jgi:hypothetical protein
LAAATLIAGLVAVFVSGLTATLITALAGDLSVVLAASFGAAPRPILVTFLDKTTAFLETAAVDFRASLPFVLFTDIIPLDPGGVFSFGPRSLMNISDVEIFVNGEPVMALLIVHPGSRSALYAQTSRMRILSFGL